MEGLVRGGWQLERVYIVWRGMIVPSIVVCGGGLLVEEKWQDCFVKYFPAQEGYLPRVPDVRTIVEDVIRYSILAEVRFVD